MSEDAYQIASFILHIVREQFDCAIARIEALPNVSVPIKDASSSKAIAVLDVNNDALLKALIKDLEQVDGVLSATLVYHQIESTDSQSSISQSSNNEEVL